MTILHDLISLYNSLSVDRAFHSVIAIILQNLAKIPGLSLEETAELCNTSIITLNRLLKQINCPSFRAFKQQISEVVNGYSKYNRCCPYSQESTGSIISPSDSKSVLPGIYNYFSHFQDTFEDLKQRIDLRQLEKAADILHHASDIHTYGPYAASHAKQQLQVDLMFSGKRVICYCNAADEAKDALTITPRSAVIAQVIASYKNYSEHLPVIKGILARKIPTIIITSTTTPNNFGEADCILSFCGTDTAMDNYFIDMIYNLLCIAHRTKYID